MLATPTPTPGVPPLGDGWQHEVKWDGQRLLADVAGGRLRLSNRNEIDVTSAYPELGGLATEAGRDVLLDGEMVALGPDGTPSFERIASRFHLRGDKAVRASKAVTTTYMVFDLLRLDGVDLTRLPLSERRSLLDDLDLIAPGVSVPPVYDDGETLAHATRAQGLEGVVSKRLESAYTPGLRSPDWLKIPHRRELVGVIGGWVPETDSASRLGSVWFGQASDESTFDRSPVLYPLGRGGSGLAHDQRDALLQVLRTVETRDCPFDPRPFLDSDPRGENPKITTP